MTAHRRLAILATLIALTAILQACAQVQPVPATPSPRQVQYPTATLAPTATPLPTFTPNAFQTRNSQKPTNTPDQPDHNPTPAPGPNLPPTPSLEPAGEPAATPGPAPGESETPTRLPEQQQTQTPTGTPVSPTQTPEPAPATPTAAPTDNYPENGPVTLDPQCSLVVEETGRLKRMNVIVVWLTPGLTQADHLQLAQLAGGEITQNYPGVPAVTITIPCPEAPPEQAESALQQARQSLDDDRRVIQTQLQTISQPKEADGET